MWGERDAKEGQGQNKNPSNGNKNKRWAHLAGKSGLLFARQGEVGGKAKNRVEGDRQTNKRVDGEDARGGKNRSGWGESKDEH